MKTTNEQEQMIREEGESVYRQKHKRFAHNYNFENHERDIKTFGEGFLVGRLKSMEEIEKWKKEVRIEGKAKSEAQALIKWHQSNYSKLEKELQEKEQEIERLKKLLSNNEQHWQFITTNLKSKLPDPEELREAIEAYDEITTHLVFDLNKEIMDNLITIKTFLESLKTTNGEG